MTDEALLSELAAALRPSGSDLRIRKASDDNLDWTFRAEYNNGMTGAHISCVGESLKSVLSKIVEMVWAMS